MSIKNCKTCKFRRSRARLVKHTHGGSLDRGAYRNPARPTIRNTPPICREQPENEEVDGWRQKRPEARPSDQSGGGIGLRIGAAPFRSSAPRTRPPACETLRTAVD